MGIVRRPWCARQSVSEFAGGHKPIWATRPQIVTPCIRLLLCSGRDRRRFRRQRRGSARRHRGGRAHGAWDQYSKLVVNFQVVGDCTTSRKTVTPSLSKRVTNGSRLLKTL